MTARPSRFTQSNPCPVCGGHDGLGRGQGVRCFGYYDGPGKYARCTREEYAGRLPQNRDGTYSHRLHGTCRCGHIHGESPDPACDPRPAATSTRRRRAEQRFRSYYTLAAFLRRRYGDGAAVRHWIYRDAAREEVFRVLRVDYRAPDGSTAKSYRPCHRAADGRWLLSRPAEPLPLYNLPSILAAPLDAIIAVLEGEKCADLAAAIGLPHATTSAHGVGRHGFQTGRRWPGDPSPFSAMPATAGRNTPPKPPPCLTPSIPPPASMSSRCLACPTATTSSNSSRLAAKPAAATPRSSPSCVP